MRQNILELPEEEQVALFTKAANDSALAQSALMEPAGDTCRNCGHYWFEHGDDSEVGMCLEVLMDGKACPCAGFVAPDEAQSEQQEDCLG